MRHPALRTPETARGILRALPGGRFVKDQALPRREVSEVGDRFIRIRKSADSDENVLPIPDEMLPLLRVLGLLVGGNVTDALDAFAVTFGDDPSGWQVDLAPRTSAAEPLQIRLIGCGGRLERIEIDEPGGVRRTYFLGDD